MRERRGLVRALMFEYRDIDRRLTEARARRKERAEALRKGLEQQAKEKRESERGLAREAAIVEREIVQEVDLYGAEDERELAILKREAANRIVQEYEVRYSPLSIYLSIYPSIHPSIYSSTLLSYLSVYPSTYPYPFISFTFSLRLLFLHSPVSLLSHPSPYIIPSPSPPAHPKPETLNPNSQISNLEPKSNPSDCHPSSLLS